MPRLLIALITVIGGMLLLRRWLRRGDSPPPSPPLAPAESMVACHHCGLHIPASESIVAADQRHYCCQTHLRLGGKTQDQ